MGMIHCEYARLAAEDFDKARTDPTWALEHIDELAGEWVQMDLPAQEARYFSIGTVWGPLHNVPRTHGGMPVDPVQGGAELGSADGITPADRFALVWGPRAEFGRLRISAEQIYWYGYVALPAGHRFPDVLRPG